MKMQVVVYESGNRVVHYDNIEKIFDAERWIVFKDEFNNLIGEVKTEIVKIEITLENLE